MIRLLTTAMAATMWGLEVSMEHRHYLWSALFCLGATGLCVIAGTAAWHENAD